MEDLEDFTVSQDENTIASGVFGLNSLGVGRRISNAFLRDMMQNFDHERWGSIGPDLMTRVAQEICQVQEVNPKIENF